MSGVEGPGRGSRTASRCGADTALAHLAVGQNSQEYIGNVVGEGPAVRGVGRRPPVAVWQDVLQNGAGGPACFVKRVETRLLERMGKRVDELGVLRRFPTEVRVSALARQEYRL